MLFDIMNSKLIDMWSVLHFFFAFIITIMFIQIGVNLNYVFFIIIFYEILEHSFMGDWVFDWFKAKRKETAGNTILDIIIGILGFIFGIAYLT